MSRGREWECRKSKELRKGKEKTAAGVHEVTEES